MTDRVEGFDATEKWVFKAKIRKAFIWVFWFWFFTNEIATHADNWKMRNLTEFLIISEHCSCWWIHFTGSFDIGCKNNAARTIWHFDFLCSSTSLTQNSRLILYLWHDLMGKKFLYLTVDTNWLNDLSWYLFLCVYNANSNLIIFQNIVLLIIQIFAPFIMSLPTSADAQVFKRWREKLHDPTLIYSRTLIRSTCNLYHNLHSGKIVSDFHHLSRNLVPPVVWFLLILQSRMMCFMA